MSDIEMKVYVGTYHKYNSGSLAGKWLNVEDYFDKEDFLTACAELHKNEHDPELMFQDHEGIPAKYINESVISSGLWDEFIPLSGADREIVELYLEHLDDLEADSILERFEGTYENGPDYVQEFLDSTGDLKDVPDWLQGHIDFDSIWRDWQHDKDSFRANGKLYVFRNDD